MTTPSLPDALRACIEAFAVATPGAWEWSENGNILGHMPDDYDETREVAAVYTERDDGLAPKDAVAILAAENLIRQHGPALEALLRDAELWRRANGTFVSGEEEVRCHVLIGVNEWKSGEWRAFHQVTPEEFAETLALMPGFVLAGPKP